MYYNIYFSLLAIHYPNYHYIYTAFNNIENVREFEWYKKACYDCSNKTCMSWVDHKDRDYIKRSFKLYQNSLHRTHSNETIGCPVLT